MASTPHKKAGVIKPTSYISVRFVSSGGYIGDIRTISTSTSHHFQPHSLHPTHSPPPHLPPPKSMTLSNETFPSRLEVPASIPLSNGSAMASHTQTRVFCSLARSLQQVSSETLTQPLDRYGWMVVVQPLTLVPKTTWSGLHSGFYHSGTNCRDRLALKRNGVDRFGGWIRLLSWNQPLRLRGATSLDLVGFLGTSRLSDTQVDMMIGALHERHGRSASLPHSTKPLGHPR